MSDLDRQFDAILDECFPPEATTELRSVVESDPDAMRRWIERSFLHAALSEQSHHLRVGGMDLSEVQSVERSTPSAISRGHSDDRSRLRTIYLGVAIAAALLICIGLIAIYSASPNADSPGSKAVPAPIATLIWADAPIDAEDPISTGDSFGPQTIRTAAGETELWLISGATVHIHGEAQFTMHGKMSATLTRGSATFDCPPSAKGFTVYLPRGMKIVDLGTGFRVAVDAEGQATIDVTVGRIRLSGPDGDAREFVASQRIVTKDGRIVALPPRVPVGPAIAEAGFESPDVGARRGRYVDAHPSDALIGGAWQFTEGGGITGRDGALAMVNPVDGNQAAFLYNAGGAVFQDVTIEPGDLGVYTLGFEMEARNTDRTGNPVRVSFGRAGEPLTDLGVFTPLEFDRFVTSTTQPFGITEAGTYRVRFEGLGIAGHDVTSFIDMPRFNYVAPTAPATPTGGPAATSPDANQTGSGNTGAP